jgi:hypothetical protein
MNRPIALGLTLAGVASVLLGAVFPSARSTQEIASYVRQLYPGARRFTYRQILQIHRPHATRAPPSRAGIKAKLFERFAALTPLAVVARAGASAPKRMSGPPHQENDQSKTRYRRHSTF